jgi:tRNA modification GTPase
LFNRLVERERAIVTAMPGTTRDLVSETVAIGGIPVKLVDTAGMRKALDEAEAIGIRKSMEALADADMVLVVLDASQPLHEEDEELLRQVAQRKAIVVANKSDLAATGSLPGVAALSASAATGAGIAELRDEILRQIAGDGGAAPEAGFLTNVRQASAVTESLKSLDAAAESARSEVPHEMILLDLYGALRRLDEITGATTADDIMNLIFGSFCVVK